MPTSGFLDIIDTFVKKMVVPGVVDNVFKHDGLMAYLRKNNVETFPGGSAIQENIRYAGLTGGPYAKGGSFDITKKQTDTGTTHYPKHYYVNVTEFLEDINVYVKGPEAPFKLIDNDMQNAADTMAAYLSICLYMNGQRAGYTTCLNGLAEMINDNATNSWDANQYTTYGTLSRATTAGAALKGKVTNVAGAITYNMMESTFNDTVIGTEMPNIAQTTNKVMTYLRQRFQPMQKVEGMDPDIGFKGLKFNGATVMQSQYCPGTAISAATDPIVTALMSQLGAGFVYPTMTSETLFWLNTKYFKMYITNDPLFGFGFTGFKRTPDSTVVAGQYLFAGNVVCTSPRLQHQLTGITS